ncbi:hypothetical protein [Halosimplex halophilum]|uniref:hypothetical protein n=1 Tax=Halosimplex halophilum TaxID=2559572 RepID=UPI00107F82A3|nr:hypothetical protein [Halosimplex halophilum]
MSLVTVSAELARVGIPRTDEDVVVETREGSWVEAGLPFPGTPAKLHLCIGDRAPLVEVARRD